MNQRITLLLAPFVALAGCAHGPTVVRDAEVAAYRLGPDDLVDVMVWKEPALSATVPVRPDGKITLPMAGDVPAAGHTTDELREAIAARLKPYVAEPVVSVMVKEVRAARFFVLGEVAHPGAFPLTGQLTVLEAVSVAGGPTEFARRSRVVVIRPNDKGRRERLSVDLDDILDGRAAPLALRPGDTVYVP